jgi:hypothetical protein
MAQATDGHSLIVVSARGEGAPYEATYDARAIAKGAKLARGKLGVCELADGVLVFRDGAGAVLRVEPSASTLPAFLAVIPREVPAGGRPAVNAAYLAEHCETHAMFASPKTRGITIATAADPLAPMTIVSESSEGFSCLSVIMPMRMWDTGEIPGARIHEHIRRIVGAPIAAIGEESEAAE